MDVLEGCGVSNINAMLLLEGNRWCTTVYMLFPWWPSDPFEVWAVRSLTCSEGWLA